MTVWVFHSFTRSKPPDDCGWCYLHSCPQQTVDRCQMPEPSHTVKQPQQTAETDKTVLKCWGLNSWKHGVCLGCLSHGRTYLSENWNGNPLWDKNSQLIFYIFAELKEGTVQNNIVFLELLRGPEECQGIGLELEKLVKCCGFLKFERQSFTCYYNCITNLIKGNLIFEKKDLWVKVKGSFWLNPFPGLRNNMIKPLKWITKNMRNKNKHIMHYFSFRLSLLCA